MRSKKVNHLLAPTTSPIVAPLDNPPEAATMEVVAASEVVEDISAVSLPMMVALFPDNTPSCVVDAVDVADAENVEPGTVGFV